ncbi:CAP Gly-rich domain-containing protein, partial [Ochromonadaceae sp. CCMP2298]
PGTIRFIGHTAFAAGIWIGVELSMPGGKNDGTIGDRRYFKCPRLHGIFVR